MKQKLQKPLAVSPDQQTETGFSLQNQSNAPRLAHNRSAGECLLGQTIDSEPSGHRHGVLVWPTFHASHLCQFQVARDDIGHLIIEYAALICDSPGCIPCEGITAPLVPPPATQSPLTITTTLWSTASKRRRE